MKKKKELFLFFSIKDVTKFKKVLHTKVVPLITSTAKLLGGAHHRE